MCPGRHYAKTGMMITLAFLFKRLNGELLCFSSSRNFLIMAMMLMKFVRDLR